MDAASAGPAASASELPSLDRVLRSVEFSGLLAGHGHTRVAALLRSHLAGLRESATQGRLHHGALDSAALAAAVTAALARANASRLRAVFNLTGTVLHTNFGRALLPAVAADAVARAATTPVSVEFDPKTVGAFRALGDPSALPTPAAIATGFAWQRPRSAKVPRTAEPTLMASLTIATRLPRTSAQSGGGSS